MFKKIEDLKPKSNLGYL